MFFYDQKKSVSVPNLSQIGDKKIQNLDKNYELKRTPILGKKHFFFAFSFYYDKKTGTAVIDYSLSTVCNYCKM